VSLLINPASRSVTTTLIYQEILVPRAMAFKENKCFSIRHYQLPLMFFCWQNWNFLPCTCWDRTFGNPDYHKSCGKVCAHRPVPCKARKVQKQSPIETFQVTFYLTVVKVILRVSQTPAICFITGLNRLKARRLRIN